MKLYFVHTGEKAVITYKRNGKFDPKGLQELNRFLRDWRRNEPTKMDPRLFDVVWQVYQSSGATDYINVVSAYRSPATNALLRSRSKGVAKQSQHMLGKAMDFYIPGVRLATLRELGMKIQAGGVGYYPNSGSPFVHMDVGNVRSWPRMSRNELVRLFPTGKTMHIPADGSPLPGYDQAFAEYKARGGAKIEMASIGQTKKKGFFQTLFGGGGDEDEESTVASDSEDAPAKLPPARQKPVIAATEEPVMTASADPSLADLNAPVPLVRPAFREQPVDGSNGTAVALVSPRNAAAEAAFQAATPTVPPAEPETYADLTQFKIPVPTLMGKRGMKGDAETDVLTASAGPLDGTAAQNDQLSSIPVPVDRPAVAEAILAKQDGSSEAAADDADQADLSPAMVAALDARDKREEAALAALPGASDVNGGSDSEEDDDMADSDNNQSMEVAALDTSKATPSKSTDFGDAFDQPAATVKPTPKVMNTVPAAKGGRVSKTSLEMPLTQQVLSNWATSQARVEVENKSVKAPRFVSNLRTPATTGPTGGFSKTTAQIDPGRFSGAPSTVAE